MKDDEYSEFGIVKAEKNGKQNYTFSCYLYVM